MDLSKLYFGSSFPVQYVQITTNLNETIKSIEWAPQHTISSILTWTCANLLMIALFHACGNIMALFVFNNIFYLNNMAISCFNRLKVQDYERPFPGTLHTLYKDVWANVILLLLWIRIYEFLFHLKSMVHGTGHVNSQVLHCIHYLWWENFTLKR